MDCAVHHAGWEYFMKVILAYFVLTSHCGPKLKQTTKWYSEYSVSREG